MAASWSSKSGGDEASAALTWLRKNGKLLDEDLLDEAQETIDLDASAALRAYWNLLRARPRLRPDQDGQPAAKSRSQPTHNAGVGAKAARNRKERSAAPTTAVV